MKLVAKSSSLIILAILLFIIPAAHAQPDIAAVEENIHQRLAKGNILGISIAYIYPDGSTQFISRGTLTTNRKQPVDKNTIFEMGSVSNTFTTLILARMASQHRISLDDPIDKFLPNPVQTPAYRGQKITLLNLATHTSGLPRMPSNISPRDSLNPYADYTKRDLYFFLNHYNLTAAPGLNYRYSNFGVDLLGYLLARAAGTPYEQLLRTYVTVPLKMKDTGIRVSSKNSSRLSMPYNGTHPAVQREFGVLKGTGGIHSTAADMATYIKAQMGLLITGFEKVINVTHEIQFNKGGDNIDAVGLGWMQSTKKDTIIYHSGETGGFSSFIGYNKQKERGVVVLASVKNPVDDIGFHMLDTRHPLKQPQSVVKQKIGKPVKSAEPGIPILNRYTGTYLTTNGAKYYVFRRGTQLRVQLAGKSSQKVFAKSNHRFFFKSEPAEIEFSNDGGSSQNFTLYKNGQTIKARRANRPKNKSQKETPRDNSSQLKRYEGVYKIRVGHYITITKEGNQLMAQSSGQEKIAADRISKNKFSLRSVDAEIEFIMNGDGVFSQMKIYKSGQVFVATRLND